ncbi:MAG: ATP-binding protein [Aureliella sp.]
MDGASGMSGEKFSSESDKRLRLVLAASQMGVWEYVPRTGELTWSPECLTILDIGSCDSTLDEFLQMVHPEDRSKVIEATQGALESRRHYSAEFRLRKPDGGTRWVHHQGQADYDRRGHVERVLGTIRDITADKLAAEQLRASEMRLRETFENLIVGCQILDFDLRYVYVNANAALHGRRRREELLGVHFADAYPGVESTELYRRILRCLDKRTTERLDNEFMFPDGSVGIFELSIQPVPEGALIVSADVTQERQLAERLVQSQKLEAVGRLAGGVAHDFNNLLTVIHGHCDLLQAAESQGELAEGRNLRSESIAAIRGAGQRAARLTKQLLSFSRNAFVNAEAFDVNAALERSSDFIKSLVGEAVVFQLKLDPALRVVKIDSAQFEQTILNLVLNARDAMPHGGTLTIATSNMTSAEVERHLPPVMRNGNYIQIKVSDTGVGMTPEVRSRIFEPFFTTKAVGRGTGLGLPVVHGAVQQAGGHIALTSEPGAGTTFRLFYPCQPERFRIGAVEEPQVQGIRTSKILLVEDEDSVRTIVRISLELQGCQVIECSGAAQALESLHVNRPFDLLVTDVVMPEMRGPELAQALREHQPELRVLYMSGYADESIGLKAALRPGDDFLQKPFSPIDLARRVGQLLSRQ